VHAIFPYENGCEIVHGIAQKPFQGLLVELLLLEVFRGLSACDCQQVQRKLRAGDCSHSTVVPV